MQLFLDIVRFSVPLLDQQQEFRFRALTAHKGNHEIFIHLQLENLSAMDETVRRPRLQWTLVASAAADAGGSKLADSIYRILGKRVLKVWCRADACCVRRVFGAVTPTCIFFRASFTLILRVRRARFPILLIRGRMGLVESRSVCPRGAPAGQGPCWPGSRHAQVVPARTCPTRAAQQWQ